MKRPRLAFLVVLSSAAPIFAQESASYALREQAFNNGGDPRQGIVMSSPMFAITLDSIGESIAGGAMTSSSYAIGSGHDGRYVPALEVLGLRLRSAYPGSSTTILEWSPEPSVGAYGLYRDLLSVLGTGYGVCVAHDLTIESATDAGVPAIGRGYFYLVTAENRLAEEGTLGFDSLGAERPNATPCP